MKLKSALIISLIPILFFAALNVRGQVTIKQYREKLLEANNADDSVVASVTLVDLYIERNIDSANYFLEITKRLSIDNNDTLGLSTYYLLVGKMFKERLLYDSAIIAYKNSIKLYTQIDYKDGLEFVNVELGYLFRNKGLLDSSNFYMKKVYDFSEDIDIKTDALNGIALNFKSAGAYDKALESFYQIMDLSKSGVTDDLSSVLINIGLVFSEQELNEDAKKYYRLSLQEAIQSDNKKSIAFAEKMLGNNFRHKKEYDSALYYLNNALDKFLDINSVYQIVSTSIGLSSTYTELEKWEEADKKLAFCREVIDQHPNLSLEIYYYKSLANYQSNNPSIPLSSAIASMDKAEKAAKESLFTDEYADIYKMKSTFLEKSDPVAALKYYKKYTHLNDSIMSLKSKNYTSMLQTRFETAKKDQEILNLQQEKSIDALQLKQQRILIISAIALLVLLLTAGILFYKQKKLKLNQALENLQQRLLRIQMNPHFIFNALMAIQNYMIKNNPLDAGIYLSKFAKLMRQTLELSREEFISLEEEKELLENYIEIQQLRSINKFRYVIEIDEDLINKDIKIPPMYAQPFVENAIEHGNLSEIEDGLLTIRFEQKNDQLVLSVTDNGVGVDNATEKKSHNSLSTIITKERLDILEKKFKMNLSLSISNAFENQIKRGTRVQITLPLLET